MTMTVGHRIARLAAIVRPRKATPAELSCVEAALDAATGGAPVTISMICDVAPKMDGEPYSVLALMALCETYLTGRYYGDQEARYEDALDLAVTIRG